jgi:hypothetical protein
MDDQTKLIIIGLVLVFAAFWVYGCINKEGFDSTPYSSSEELDSYYRQNEDIQNIMIDNMTCHKSCCGDQWPVPFDGLTPRELKVSIANQGANSEFVRTSHSCGNGINGVGCPCVTPAAYKALVNHGSNQDTLTHIDPTFYIRNDVVMASNTMTPYEEIQSRRSPYTDKPKLNDLTLQRPQNDLSMVQSNGSTIMPKDKQVEKYL